VIGGLFTSTVLSLLVVPVVFIWMDDFEAWMQRRVAWARERLGRRKAAPSTPR
jgi:hypothetical protein